ncbi:MAG TPA: CYTH and CHAD domain-containing protein [Propionicimonas sp.]|mgnify:FL=1|nr:CYTH and CHAD domain-containing protein [Propionicimonas sp.]HQA77666.1 CYTH and CHAD domain-containing protein [Propionicimonas sp.]
MAQLIEAERKYALTTGQELPDLAAVITPGPVGEFELTATYYDAPDLRLTRAWQVIRHRVGGADAGWHLKLPGPTSDQRIEVHADGAAPRVPDEFRRRVATTLAGAPLVPVAVLRTNRREQQLLGAGGDVLAVSCTDDVVASVGARRERWREAEIELVGGDLGLLDRLEAVLTAHGIDRAQSGSKIGRALADAIAAQRALDGRSSAGEAVHAYLAEQVGVLQNREADVLVDAPDAVHRSRVATRRLRSALRTYARVFADQTGTLRNELRWHAEELGAPRDAEVLQSRLAEAVRQLPETDRLLVGERLQRSLGSTHAAAHAKLVASMRTAGYEALQLALSRLLAEPQWSPAAQRPAAELLPRLLARAVARVGKLAEHAASRPSDLTRWHEVRKAAKAARYGSELLVPVLGAGAEVWRARWEAVTEGLGAVQDAVVAQQVIGDVAWHAVADGLPRLPFDDLRQHEDRLLRESLAAGRAALADALALDVP